MDTINEGGGENTTNTSRKWPKKTRVTEGIRRDESGYEAYVCVARIQKSRRFSHRTPIRVMRAWREQTRAGLTAKYRPDVPNWPLEPVLPRRTTPLPKSPDGWCYIYVIQDGPNVKIGRAVNPLRRLAKLQTAHHRKLHLVCAVPGHAVIEAAIQQRFAHLRREGEWFHVDTDMMQFIERLNNGENPIELVWDEKLCSDQAGPPIKFGEN